MNTHSYNRVPTVRKPCLQHHVVVISEEAVQDPTLRFSCTKVGGKTSGIVSLKTLKCTLNIFATAVTIQCKGLSVPGQEECTTDVH